MKPEIRAKFSIVDAKELEHWELPQATLEEGRRKYGGASLDNEDLLLRFFAAPASLMPSKPLRREKNISMPADRSCDF